MSNYQVQAQAIYRRLLPSIGNLIATKARNRRKEAAVAKEAKNIVLERTAAGIDVNGRRFVPYSAGYAKRKQGLIKALQKFSGKRANKEATGYPAWLRATGQMMASLTADVKAEASLRGLILTIKFRFVDENRALIASYHNELGAGKSRVKRQFLGLSREGTARRKDEEERLYKAWKNG